MVRKTTSIGGIGVLAALLFAGASSAVPVIWPGNGHAYEFIDAPGMRWSDADVAARGRIFQGVNGHLAAITSADEGGFVADLISNGGVVEAWIGGHQPNPADPPDQGWAWVTGEDFSYTNWDADEPNDNLGDEHYLGVWGPDGDGPVGTWNDQEDAVFYTNITGYLVEWEPDHPSPSRPASWGAIKARWQQVRAASAERRGVN